MIAISTQGGRLHVFADIAIPNAEAGQWSPARIGKLIQSIEKAIRDTAEAGDFVDGSLRELTACATVAPARKGCFKSSLLIDA